MFKPAEYGAYSELFAALSPTLGKENNGGHIVPWVGSEWFKRT